MSTYSKGSQGVCVCRESTSGVSSKHGVSLACREKLACREFSGAYNRPHLLNYCTISLVDIHVGCQNSYQFYNVILRRRLSLP